MAPSFLKGINHGWIRFDICSKNALVDERVSKSLDDEKHREMIRVSEYSQVWDEHGLELSIETKLIWARTRNGLTQKEKAQRIRTTQPIIARMESGTPPANLMSTTCSIYENKFFKHMGTL